MKILLTSWFLLGAVIFGATFSSQATQAHEADESETTTINHESELYVFGRDDCGFCKKLFAYLEDEKIDFTYLNIHTSEEASALYDQVTAKHDISKVTPVTVVGEKVIVGFNGANTTGTQIKQAIKDSKSSEIHTIEDHLALASVQEVTLQGGCTGISCDSGGMDFVFELPFFGIVDLRSFSLFTLSAVLGVIDGFNPCAMWVLITFLVLLSQAGSKRKMIFLAGLFILAQGIMYNLILNVWYKTWDFVALDQIVTPIVGFIAVGGAVFFLWRWHKNKEAALVCDITDMETQSKTVNKFKQIVQQPITITSIFAILVIAFSVNIIEFACSIGIPQAYTKILELNNLDFIARQWYILVFTLGYMIDDVIVFGLAIWGYSNLQSHGGKYAQMSLLVGGILMLILGIVLIANPGLLVL